MSEEFDLALETLPSEYEIEKEGLQHFFAATGTRYGRREELRTTPLFSLAVKHTVDNSNDNTARPSAEEGRREILPQDGLLGFHIGEHESISQREPLYVNVDGPNSVFICGSQGSGKSYTLSCMLENCILSNSDIGKLKPSVAGVVFNYNVNSTPSPAEAAHLCSRGIQLNVFFTRSSDRALIKAFEKFGDKHGNLKVIPLMFRSSDLSIERMNRLMAVATKDGPPPLYMEVVQRILREMAIESEVLDYLRFKSLLAKEQLNKDQTSRMSLRITVLEGFFVPRLCWVLDRVSTERSSTGMDRGIRATSELSPSARKSYDCRSQ